ncbi:MAG: diguanylate cyclase [Desulfovibrionaceae bacterium]
MMRRRVRDVMTSLVVSVKPDESVSRAVHLMGERRISCVPVLEDGKAVGIFTERNLVRHIARGATDLFNAPIRRYMTAPALTVRDDRPLYEAFHILDKNAIRHLIVVRKDDTVVGVLTLSSIMDQVGNDLLVELQPLATLMSKVVYAVRDNPPVRDILAEMAERSISCAVSAGADGPQGILTERDVVRLTLDGADLSTVCIKEAMSRPVVSVSRDTQVHEAARIMRREGIRRLVVVDDAGGIEGIATQSDIMRALESRYVRGLRQTIDEKTMELRSTIQERDYFANYLECILDASPDLGIVAADTGLRIVYCNRCAERMFGVASDQAVGLTVEEVHGLMGVDAGRLRDVTSQVRRDAYHTFTFDMERGGSVRHFQARIAAMADAQGATTGYVYMVQDITERRKAEDGIRYMAYHDSLTGLPNRMAFAERFGLELAHAQRKGGMIAVLVVDLNKFKEVNDTLGHFAGDVVLRTVASRFQEAMRKSDTVARVGGDEFVLVLPEISDCAAAMALADKIVDRVARPVEIKGHRLDVSLSVGVAFFPEHGEEAKQLFDRADAAMYEAKNRSRAQGGSQICRVAAPEGGAVCGPAARA